MKLFSNTLKSLTMTLQVMKMT
ncbi:BgTH12-02442 [Blumeria graminis f. sp. triticale]|uniref:Bgt-51434 n=3 Tax=Blumeria graminis TaxID=34373 RepID=A0A9X9MGI5_BLUGR|nr:BgTH12-02442 [Blumeria graminis f. sp. triticale]VDB86242.1 Bgt-51434 [Blumeria graminis f. sp. tritici]